MNGNHHNHLNNRLDVLDAIRGFALFGILIANIRSLSGWDFMSDSLKAQVSDSGYLSYDFLNTLLIDGKFYTLFSLLFGIGFSLQLSRLTKGDSSALFIYIRRLLILLTIGLVHLVLFWFGDILTFYALLGFVLLLVNRFSDRGVLILAGVMFLVPIIGYLLAWGLNLSMDLGFYGLGTSKLANNFGEQAGDILALIKLETWQEFFAFTTSGSLLRVGYVLESWRLPKVLFVMLIGLWCGRKIIQGEILNQPKLLLGVAVFGFTFGAVASYFYAQIGAVFAFAGAPNATGFLRMLLYMCSVFPMGFAYGALFLLAWGRWKQLLMVFAAPGRMALTNYLMQTVFCITLFYGVGFNYAGTVGPLGMLLIVIAIFASQVIVSKLWLSQCKYGPLEWVWRCLTYGQLLSLRK